MKAVKTILIGLCTFALMYLMMSFIIWDLNAGNWGADERFLVISLGGIIGAFLSINYFLETYK